MGFKSKTTMLPWLAWALIVVLVDQFTKILIAGYYSYGQTEPVTTWFNIVHAHNAGAAFSFLIDAGGWQRWMFTGIGLVAVVVVLWMLRRHSQQKLFAFALASIMGGAIGNLLDRVRLGYVIDFLDFHWGQSHFAAFNAADSAITLGAMCLIADELLRVRRSKS